jgi:DNA-directed RNA polymerase II subunit RPB1
MAAGKRQLRENVKKCLEELDQNPALQPITNPPLRPIKSIQFGILSPEEILAHSVCEVNSSRVTNPFVGTVYDERMGPCNSRGICTTCNEDIRICPGHFGHIELAVPVIHPMFTKILVSILNCICPQCSKLKLSKQEIELEIQLETDRYIRFIDRLNIIVKKCTSVPYCRTCDLAYPQVKEFEGQFYKIYDNSKTKKARIEIDELRQILINISNEDLELIGLQPQERTICIQGRYTEPRPTFRPEWLILERLPVLPPMSRPPDHDGDNRSDDDLTTTYTDIIKYVEKLRDPKLGEKTRDEVSKNLHCRIQGLFDNTSGTVTRTSGKPSKGIKERIVSKNGIVRKHLMGKRVDCSARTVITADPNLHLEELGVPEEIVETLSFPEKVHSGNITELTKLLQSGKINTLIRGEKTIKVFFALQAGRRVDLRVGDIVYRQLRNGDTVVFNRQPTLHRGSMMAHKVRVLPGKTFRLNLSVTTPYNADFDGDEMQAHVPQDYGTVAEVQELLGVKQLIVSSQANRPIMGVIQDSLVGAYLLTHPDTMLEKGHFMDCVMSAGTEYLEKLPSLFARALRFYPRDKLFNGRVLFSILLPDDFEHRFDADPDDPVLIKSGILVSGVVDKEVIGRSHGNIIHRLYKEYSPQHAADFLSEIQYLVNRWLQYRGFSVGIADFIISDQNKEGVKRAIQKAYIEIDSIQRSHDSEEIKEMRISAALNNRGQSLAIDGLCPNNRLETMIHSGSKGNRMNIIQIAGHLGQNTVGGQRIQADIDSGQRTLPCFERGDKHPRTRGFIENSFMDGLSPEEFFCHAKAGREGVINTAVKTRETGYMSRKLEKRLEDQTVQYDGTVRNSVDHVVSFSYGDSLDPTLVYNNDGPSFVNIDNVVAQLNSDGPGIRALSGAEMLEVVK